MTSRHWVVDRIEETLAVLEADDGTTTNVPLSELPDDVAEGAVLSVPVSRLGVPDWASAARDSDEERKRLEEARRILDELERRDGGGDVVL